MQDNHQELVHKYALQYLEEDIFPKASGGTGIKMQFRGAAAKFQETCEHEVILSGPSETGKTLACLVYINNLAWKYPKSQHVIVRKILNDVQSTVVQSFIEKVLGERTLVKVFGGSVARWFDYPNGSRVWVGGLDHPGKVLSSERDTIYVNQAEQITLEDWEILSTRTTGRAGHMPFAQVLGDCNPSYPQHWIRTRKSLIVLESRHEDNPALYDDNGNITARGERTLAVLDDLTGVRKSRLRYGMWVQAEGVIYDIWDDAIHLINNFKIPDDWRRFRAVDFGYTNPFCCQWWAVDSDGRMYRYRELYSTQKTVAVHAKRIKELSANDPQIEATVCDHDAEDRATLEENGIPTMPATKDVSRGIQAVTDRLKKQNDNKPMLFLLRGSVVETDPALQNRHRPVCTEEEIPAYVWAVVKEGKPVKEEPNKADDHGCDTMRYAVMYADISGGRANSQDIILKGNQSRWANDLATRTGSRWKR